MPPPARYRQPAVVYPESDIQCGTFDVPVTRSTLTHHFRVLRESGVIGTQRSGIRFLNYLRRTELDAAFPGLLDSVLAGSSTALETEGVV